MLFLLGFKDSACYIMPLGSWRFSHLHVRSPKHEPRCTECIALLHACSAQMHDMNNADPFMRICELYTCPTFKRGLVTVAMILFCWLSFAPATNPLYVFLTQLLSSATELTVGMVLAAASSSNPQKYAAVCEPLLHVWFLLRYIFFSIGTPQVCACLVYHSCANT